jgi:hypothetical protein
MSDAADRKIAELESEIEKLRTALAHAIAQGSIPWQDRQVEAEPQSPPLEFPESPTRQWPPFDGSRDPHATEIFGRYKIEIFDDGKKSEDGRGDYSVSMRVTHVHPRMRDEVLLTGFIKYDHCSNWHMDDCIHFCEQEEAAEFGKMLEHLYELADDYLIDN